jgi:hypothetical protein
MKFLIKDKQNIHGYIATPGGGERGFWEDRRRRRSSSSSRSIISRSRRRIARDQGLLDSRTLSYR